VDYRTIATGHYVRTDTSMREFEGDAAADVDENNGRGNGHQKNPRLLMGLDDSKDQSYFLCMTKVRKNTPALILIVV
jgi:tRNA U34 2-thiouridine synthase MnmA/TrmU